MRHEEQYQKAIVDYIRKVYPDTLFTISPITRLSPQAGKRQKDMGYSAGTPDIMIFEPRGQWHGLFIEVKTPETPFSIKGKVSHTQVLWHGEAQRRGYSVCVSWGSEPAMNCIDRYFALEKSESKDEK